MKDKARSLKESVTEEERDRLIGRVIARLGEVSEQLSSREFMDEYRERSCVLGREVVFEKDNITMSGTAERIDDDGALYVRCRGGGSSVRINSGEISLQSW